MISQHQLGAALATVLKEDASRVRHILDYIRPGALLTPTRRGRGAAPVIADDVATALFAILTTPPGAAVHALKILYSYMDLRPALCRLDGRHLQKPFPKAVSKAIGFDLEIPPASDRRQTPKAKPTEGHVASDFFSFKGHVMSDPISLLEVLIWRMWHDPRARLSWVPVSIEVTQRERRIATFKWAVPVRGRLQFAEIVFGEADLVEEMRAIRENDMGTLKKILAPTFEDDLAGMVPLQVTVSCQAHAVLPRLVRWLKGGEL